MTPEELREAQGRSALRTLATGVLGGYYTREDLEMVATAAANGARLGDLVEFLVTRGDAQV